MASGLRARLRARLRTLGVGAALAGLLLVTPPGTPAHAEDPPPPAAPSAPSALDQRFAGTRAGEGRARPGRPPGTLPYVPDASAQPIADPFGSPPPPPPSAQPAVARKVQPSRLSTTSDLRVHVLSMGAGLTLTGLGLGFLALRLRRP
ncbi:hypothetical protein [Streptomyces sp. TLI_146]|uniref:hypothetical protein n=1 Tax=Streptomyces sp. TLI_146 TaxID=1938858 RepID=UPI000CBA4DFD|nr:hypothetical protein [Streptomyces sp. TLI_146]PKV86681.1 hypothetical protein BX283_4249 [Streptomyces sp. TLI_146]